MKSNPIKIYNKECVNFGSLDKLPITQLFEGYLYLYDTSNSKWLKRLFRFNGETLVCLSPKVINMRSRINTPTNDASKSLDPLLLAAEHSSSYHVPEWSIHVNAISSITLSKQQTNYILFSSSDICFTVKTLNGICRTMKAYDIEELERWVFVLNKMWNFSKNLNTQPVHPYKEAPYIPVTNNRSYQQERNAFASNLSKDKVVWIEAWIESLAQLGLHNPSHTMDHIVEDSMLEQDSTSSVSSYSIKTKSEHIGLNIVDPLLAPYPKQNQPATQPHYVDYFQDIETTPTPTDYKEYKDPSTLYYHHSFKGKPIKLVQQAPSSSIPRNKSVHQNRVSLCQVDQSPLEKIGKPI